MNLDVSARCVVRRVALLAACASTLTTASIGFSQSEPDTDGAGVPDNADNFLEIPNGPVANTPPFSLCPPTVRR